MRLWVLNSTYLYYATHDFVTHSLPPSPSLNQYSSRFKSEETQLLCLRVMVGVIILYDHIHPVGAFAIKATIDVSVCVCACACVCECKCDDVSPSDEGVY